MIKAQGSGFKVQRFPSSPSGLRRASRAQGPGFKVQRFRMQGSRLRVKMHKPNPHKPEITNSKHQITNNFQISNKTKLQLFGILNFGHCDLIVSCFLPPFPHSAFPLPHSSHGQSLDGQKNDPLVSVASFQKALAAKGSPSMGYKMILTGTRDGSLGIAS